MLAFKASNRTWSTATLSVVYNLVTCRNPRGGVCQDGSGDIYEHSCLPSVGAELKSSAVEFAGRQP